MKFRMTRYFNDSDDADSLETYLTDCSYGDWFVLYQMSKNMNRRLFFMFLTGLAKSPKWEMKNMMPTIQVVNAFKSSVKRKKADTKAAPSANSLKLNITKKVEASAPADVLTVEVENNKKQDDPQKEECTRRKRHCDGEDDDSDSDDRNIHIRNKKDVKKKEKMYESCNNWQKARSKIGSPNKLK
jgi:hypothetical protein